MSGATAPRCSIVVPVHNRVALTKQCLDAVLSDPPVNSFELIVVDDASSDSTGELLAGYGDAIKVVARSENGGFATACNDGAGLARAGYLVFLNNDTIPQPGWLDALASYADDHPEAAVVGAKLLFPDGSVQHAGVVICQDWNPRHVYAGFPADHPAVTRPRRFQAVTAACMLVRRDVFERAGGFDATFLNCLEDSDLCLRIGELGSEVHLCPDSVLHHLESISRGRRAKEIEHNARLFRERWRGRVRRDDIDCYVEDGLLRVGYRETYPLWLEISPLLASAHHEGRTNELERRLDGLSRQLFELLKETVRLTAHIAELELRGPVHGEPGPAQAPAVPAAPASAPSEAGPEGREDLLRRAEAIELEIEELQAALSAAARHNGGAGQVAGAFEPSDYLAYRRLVGELRDVVGRELPRDATVLVASRGDDELLELGGADGRHFPQDAGGSWAGHYPTDSEAAIEHLEQLREGGAEYIVFPATSLWWLERYEKFGQHLESNYPAVVREQGVCVAYALASPSAGRERPLA